MKRSSLIGSALLLAGALTACSSGSTPTGKSPAGSSPAISQSSPATSQSTASTSAAAPSSSGSKPVSGPKITIKGFAFTVTGRVSPGQEIMVHNEDSEAHTVTADSASAFDVVVPASSMAKLKAPEKAGSYKFHCNYHSNMHGTLTVG